jgi:DNA polymerase-3 subunit epsilon
MTSAARPRRGGGGAPRLGGRALARRPVRARASRSRAPLASGAPAATWSFVDRARGASLTAMGMGAEPRRRKSGSSRESRVARGPEHAQPRSSPRATTTCGGGSGSFAAIDFETANTSRDSACAVAVVRVEAGAVVEKRHWLIRPPTSEFHFTYIHGISWTDVKSAPTFRDVWREAAELAEGVEYLAAHNAPFDRSVLAACARRARLPEPALPFRCTVQLARQQFGIYPAGHPAEAPRRPLGRGGLRRDRAGSGTDGAPREPSATLVSARRGECSPGGLPPLFTCRSPRARRLLPAPGD